MNNSCAAINEKKQETMPLKHEAGPVADRFPEVVSITMNITYNQKGAGSIRRIFHFTPDSYAFFVVNCLRRDCVDGGFDLTEVITSMISSRREGSKGTLCCRGTDSSTKHSDIVYEVTIQYV
jgi:hypothetical protein